MDRDNYARQSGWRRARCIDHESSLVGLEGLARYSGNDPEGGKWYEFRADNPPEWLDGLGALPTVHEEDLEWI